MNWLACSFHSLFIHPFTCLHVLLYRRHRLELQHFQDVRKKVKEIDDVERQLVEIRDQVCGRCLDGVF